MRQREVKSGVSKMAKRLVHKRSQLEHSHPVSSETAIRPSYTNDLQIKSNVSSESSLEKTFFFGNRALNGGSLTKSDTYTMKTKKGEIQNQMSHTGFEQLQKRARTIPAFLAGSYYGYKSEVYQAAASIFERLALRKEVGECLIQYPPLEQCAPPPEFTSKQLKRQSFELAYETLKYQELLEEILADSGYFFSHPASEDMSGLVMVMLFDFQNRKWGPRCNIQGNVDEDEVKEIEYNLLNHRVHLAAALARNRVKNQSQTIDYALPEQVRKQEKCASHLPQYSWINTMKISVEDMLISLDDLGYDEFVDPDIFMPNHGKVYRRDRHCEDVLIFPADQKDILKVLDPVIEGKLILQDKTSSLAVASMMALVTADDECDLVHTDVASGLTSAHLAIMLFQKTKKKREKKELLFGRSSTTSVNRGMNRLSTPARMPRVVAYGGGSEENRLELIALFEYLDVVNIQVMSESFNNIDPKRVGLDMAKAILVTPRCTRTAVSNPIEFMLNEGDTDSFNMLRDLTSGELHNRANQAGVYHTDTVKEAMQCRTVQAVVYVTRSVHKQENEEVISNSIKWHRSNSDGLRPFLVSPPTLPLLSSDIKAGKQSDKNSASPMNALRHNFLRMRQTSQMNGCFIAVLTRELDHSEMVKRNALQGLIAPVSVETEEVDTAPQESNIRLHRKSQARISQVKKVKANNPHLFHTQASISKQMPKSQEASKAESKKADEKAKHPDTDKTNQKPVPANELQLSHSGKKKKK